MYIRRSHHDKEFLVLPNATVRDDRLSYAARGVLAELLSRSDGWETTADRMSLRAQEIRGGRNGEGRRAMRAAWSELEAAGYLHRVRVQDKDSGRWRTVMAVFDVPRDPA